MTLFEYLSYFIRFASKSTIEYINMADRKVIHLHIEEEDYYFGSVSAIYSVFSKEQLGIGYGSLRNYGLSPTKPYSNDKILINSAFLIDF